MRIGDVVTLALDRSVRVVRVEGFCERRGAAAAARALYRDLTTNSGDQGLHLDRHSPKVSPEMAAKVALPWHGRWLAAYLSLR